ncbi:hypothetical protein NOF55_15420 [Rhizobiaceae bacterium BDR2-2]|uniref:Uncharacterized protein n=1 Tax=Ectorhizobium quercum TaxID=2965071 RepID=A0AAE3N2J2_9HYPH|nr:hypothetical protein [Ectorhizobium quercum]MCX8998504.1 hypothetical protein [Ectorhizobium quercum]
MTDSTSEQPLPDPAGDDAADARIDALGQALAMLKAGEAGGPTLAEIMRLVRLMENQPEHAMAKLRHSLHRWTDVPAPERMRRDALRRLGHTEATLGALPGSERDALEATIADDIRRRFGIARLPAVKMSRTGRVTPLSF